MQAIRLLSLVCLLQSAVAGGKSPLHPVHYPFTSHGDGTSEPGAPRRMASNAASADLSQKYADREVVVNYCSS